MRRNRVRRRRPQNPQTTSSGYINPNSWLTSNYEINLDGLQGVSPDHLYGFLFSSAKDFKDHLTRSGEYKYLRATVVYSPLGGKDTDRIGIAPFFDLSNAFHSKIDFVTSGRKIRKADSSFTEVLALPSQITSSDLEAAIGGVVIYYSGDPADFGILSVLLNYQVRGRRTLDETYKAVPYKPPTYGRNG